MERIRTLSSLAAYPPKTLDATAFVWNHKRMGRLDAFNSRLSADTPGFDSVFGDQEATVADVAPGRAFLARLFSPMLSGGG